MRIKKYAIENILEKHKIARYIFSSIMALLGVLLVIWIFSWDSLLGLIITGEKSDLQTFIFWTIFAVISIIVSIVASFIITRKKRK